MQGLSPGTLLRKEKQPWGQRNTVPPGELCLEAKGREDFQEERESCSETVAWAGLLRMRPHHWRSLVTWAREVLWPGGENVLLRPKNGLSGDS